MSRLFPTLFSPFEIKGRRFKNRLFLPAHGTGYAEGGRRLFGADRDTVYLQHTMTGDPVLCEDVDTLVLACGHQARLELHEALEGKVPELHAIGDCLSPRTAEEAVLEGLKVAALI